MKWLFVTPYYKPAYVYGGPTRSVPGLCEGLARQGGDVEVFTTNAAGDDTLDVPTGRPVMKDGVTVTYFPQQRFLGRVFYSSALRRACRQRVREFDYVYTYGMWYFTSLAAGAACRKHDVSHIVSPRTGLMRWPRQRGWLRKKLWLWTFGQRYLDGAEAVHYTTEVERRESEEIGIETPGLVVPNCMDFSEFDNLPEQGHFRAQIGVDGDAPVLLFLGRLEPRKGIDISLRALAAAKEDVPDAQFVIAGPGEEDYLQTLKQLASNLGVEESTTFTGYVDADERLEALVDADVFVLTSHTENFAMAAVEAMAAETPVLLSDQVGVAEGAATAGAGVSVPLEQDAIVSQLRRLLDSPSLRDEMGANGPSHVRSTYGQDAVASQLIRAVREREKAESSNVSALHSK